MTRINFVDHKKLILKFGSAYHFSNSQVTTGNNIFLRSLNDSFIFDCRGYDPLPLVACLLPRGFYGGKVMIKRPNLWLINSTFHPKQVKPQRNYYFDCIARTPKCGGMVSFCKNRLKGGDCRFLFFKGDT